MKILHLFKTFMPDTIGGIEEFIRVLTKETKKGGIENTILVPSRQCKNTEYTQYEGIVIIRTKQTFEYASCPISFQMLKVYRSIIKDYDILHIHYPWPFADLLALLFTPKKTKIIISYHSDVVKQKVLKIFYNPLMKLFFNRADKIVVASPNLVQSSNDLKPYQKKIEVIPYGFKKPEASNPALLKLWENKAGNNFLLFIGQFRYYKGLLVLIEAMKYYSVPLVLIGQGSLENELKTKIKEYNLKNIFFAGKVSDTDKYALLELSHALVLPSIASSEAFGLALLEGAMFGKPLISTELGTGTSYINKNNITGFVVLPTDPIALAEAIKKVFTNAPLSEKMGIESYQWYLERFTVDSMVNSYIECYKDLLNEREKA